MPSMLNKVVWNNLQRELFSAAIILSNLQRIKRHHPLILRVKDALNELLCAENVETLEICQHRLNLLLDKQHQDLIKSFLESKDTMEAILEIDETNADADDKKKLAIFDEWNAVVLIQEKLNALIEHRKQHLNKRNEYYALAFSIGWIGIDFLLMIGSIILGFAFPTFGLGLLIIASLSLSYNIIDLMKECGEMAHFMMPLESANYGIGVEENAKSLESEIAKLKDWYRGIDPLVDVDSILNHRSRYLQDIHAHRTTMRRIGFGLSVLGFSLGVLGFISFVFPISGFFLLTTLFVVGAAATSLQIPLLAYRLYQEKQHLKSFRKEVDEKIRQDKEHNYGIQADAQLKDDHFHKKTERHTADTSHHSLSKNHALFHPAEETESTNEQPNNTVSHKSRY